MDCSGAIYLARSISLTVIHFYLPLTVFSAPGVLNLFFLLFLHFGHNNLMHCYGLLKECLESCLLEKNLGVLAEHESVCAQVAKKASGILASRTRVISPCAWCW